MSSLPLSGVPAETIRLPPVAERFCRYARVYTTSDPASDAVPSTQRQLDLCRMLVDELHAMGVADAEMDASGVVYATVPGNTEAPRRGAVRARRHEPGRAGRERASARSRDWNGAAFALPGDASVTFDTDDRRRSGRARRPRPDHERRHDAARLGRQGRRGGHPATRRRPDARLGEHRGASLPPHAAARVYARRGDRPRRRPGRPCAPRVPTWRTRSTARARTASTPRRSTPPRRASTSTGVGVHPGYAKGILVNALRVAAHRRLAPARRRGARDDGRARRLPPPAQR